MKKLYALARIRWLTGQEGGMTSALVGPVFLPARFEGDDSGNWWTLALGLTEPVQPGDTVVVAIAPIVEEAASSLLHAGRTFDLKEGLRTIAIGEVIKAAPLEPDNDESPLEALRRVTASIAPDQAAIVT